MLETTLISKCCKSEVREDKNDDQKHICKKCNLHCEVEEVCAYCFGTGEVYVMGSVYPNEPHQALIDTQVCICQIKEPDYEPEQ